MWTGEIAKDAEYGIDENSNTPQFKLVNSIISNIKEVYSFEFIEEKDHKLEILDVCFDENWQQIKSYFKLVSSSTINDCRGKLNN